MGAIGALAGLTLLGERGSLRRADRADAGSPRRSTRWAGDHERATKYVFVTGGVVSALGKGIVAASLGRLLKARVASACRRRSSTRT